MLKAEIDQIYRPDPSLKGVELLNDLLKNVIRPGGFCCLVIFDNQTQNSPEHEDYIINLTEQLLPSVSGIRNEQDAILKFNEFCAQYSATQSYTVIKYATGFIFTDNVNKALVYLIKQFDHQLQPGVVHVYDEYLKISVESLLGVVRRSAPFAKPVSENEVVDISPSWEELCSKFPDGHGYYDWAAYQTWVIEQMDNGVFYYAREKYNFFVWQGVSTCALSGRTRVIMENLS